MVVELDVDARLQRHAKGVLQVEAGEIAAGLLVVEHRVVHACADIGLDLVGDVEVVL
ncbi:hypothetical protein D3C71_1993460 [compost metagenome]